MTITLRVSHCKGFIKSGGLCIGRPHKMEVLNRIVKNNKLKNWIVGKQFVILQRKNNNKAMRMMKAMKTMMALVMSIALMGCQEATNLDHSVKLIPENYYMDAEQQGTVVKMEYQTKLYDTDETITKYCYVYLPYGYEENGTQRYDILYFMHGGGSTAEKFLILTT